MMRKAMLSLLGVAAVFAAAYLAWAITHPVSPPAPTPAPVAKIPAEVPAPAPQAVAPPAAPEPTVVAAPAPAPPASSDAAALAVTNPDAFVKGLNSEQNRKLNQLLGMKIGDPITELQKYQMSADNALWLFERNPKLALTDAQKQMLADVKAVYKTKLDAALSDKLAQVDEIGRKMAEIAVNAKSESDAGWDTQDLRYKQFEIMGSIHEAKEAFETDYQTSVRACLTPDQATAFDNFNRQSAASAAMLKQMINQPDSFKATPANGSAKP